ncbi:hypothetical protein DID88_004479 [Monilinia fructigena]|uniref:Smr domain-containing protein n=1 Tax=Monilinia fructigena TaxID=38457 RepID=A0A395ITB5_9HELO|nr:hypothetical protein DID88_004479 [Monilinia fructigena]
MVNNEEMMAQMEAEYCPPLDTSTFRAIITDYDLSEEEQIQTARMILDMIRQDAEIEEATGFDPSGNSGGVNTSGGEISREQNLQNNNTTNEDGTASNKSVPEWSSSTDDTSFSQGMSTLDLLEGLEFSGSEDARCGVDNGNAFTDSLGAMDVDSQEAFLLGTFPTLKPFDVKFSLKKSQGNINTAIEDLLTQSFLEETGSRRRGIEAFSESFTPAKTRRHKGKKKAQKTELSEDSTIADDTPLAIEASKWEMGRKDVEFICARTGIPMQQVSSIYHNSGASVRATILSIIDNYPTIDMESEDPIIEINAMELGRDFPSIQRSRLITLAQLTHPFTANASSYIIARNTAFQQASVAYKKSKSDPLMGGAAAYYSQQGRDANVRVKEAESAAADELVRSQCWSGGVDLHGVGVRDAVRIAREKVTEWWVSEEHRRAGSGYVRAGAGEGYKIVTGMGNHSKGGRGKLGPAVARMLIKERWKVQVGSGALMVTGVVRS